MARWSLTVCGEFDPNRHGVGLVDLRYGNFRLVLGILKLEVELLSHVCCHDLKVALGERFAKAYPGASVKGYPAHWMSLLALRSQVKWIVRIKSLWEQLHRTLPLSTVMAQCFIIDR